MTVRHLSRIAQRVLVSLPLLLALALPACQEADRTVTSVQEREVVAMQESALTTARTASFASRREDASPLQAADDAKLIRTARVSMRVTDYAVARARIEAITDHFEGFVASERESRRADRHQNQFTIRMPAERFAPLLDSLLSVGRVVERRNVEVEDVTEQYIDITARLKTKREVEARYLDLLDRAQSVEDILAVERELQKIREEIESMQGRLNHLNDRIALSTIHLTFYEQLRHGPAAAGNFLTRAADAFMGGWNGFVHATLLAIRLWPLLLLLGLLAPGAVALYRRYRHRRTGPAADSSTP